jgi:hypothetical protein
MSKKTIWVLGAVAAVIVALLVVRMVNRPSDEEMIRRALQESLQASKEGRPGGVLDLLSRDLTVNEVDPGRGQIARFVRDSRPDVDVLDDTPFIAGDEARIVSPVRIRAAILGYTMDRQIEDVTLIFRRERGREWVVLPVDKWRLYSVHAPNASLGDFVP